MNLSTDYEALLSTGELTRKEVALLRQIRVLLTERVGHPMTVAVTNPLHLLRELFTMKGAGTLIKRGSIIERHDGTLGVDLARLKGLLESAFGRRLKEGFFEQPIERVYLEESYQGAALVTSSPCGKYLSKFAVERQAQGEGIGRDLWGALIRDYPSIYWRSRPGNPVDPWYATRCDGMQRGPEWHVFWKGFDADCIPHLIRCALAAPRDLEG